VATAEQCWEQLNPPWVAAFEQAWMSFGEGNFGIGAALTDPRRDGEPIVSVGRNLVVSTAGDQPIAGNYMAHAEMNAFASLASYSAEGLSLYTTLEPCLMCSATGIFLNVAHVSYAVRDEYYEPFSEKLWPHHPYTRDRQPVAVQAFDDQLSSFARLLPLAHTLSTIPTSKPAAVARQSRPELSALAESSVVAELRQLARNRAPILAGLSLAWSGLKLGDFDGNDDRASVE
jgi:tRNA(Arg) A34 adenosine deaminase TadA